MLRAAFILYFVVLPVVINSTQVKWRPNTDFHLSLNFLDGKRPCNRKNVHFEANLISAVKMSSSNEVASLILPMNGEIELNEHATLELGDIVSSKSGVDVKQNMCTEGESYYVEKSNLAWLQSDAWQSNDYNEAFPDSRRVPCFDDDVVFPKDSQFSIILPDTIQHVHSLSIKGKTINNARFKSLVESSKDPTQAFIMNKFLGVGVTVDAKRCLSRAGCPCQDNVTAVDCSLKLCQAPTCLDPVRPTGNCCPICGGVMEFDTNVNTFDFLSFKRSVDEVIETFGGRESVVSYVGLLWRDRVQVVMVDKAAYEGSSSLAVHILSQRLRGETTSGFKQTLVSGMPLNKVGVNGQIAGITFVIVVLVFSLVYVMYQRPDLLARLNLPRSQFENTSMFSRFHNRENSITSILTSPRGSLGIRSSFRNPLFNTKKHDSSDPDLQNAEESKPQGDSPSGGGDVEPGRPGRLGPVAMSSLRVVEDLL